MQIEENSRTRFGFQRLPPCVCRAQSLLDVSMCACRGLPPKQRPFVFSTLLTLLRPEESMSVLEDWTEHSCSQWLETHTLKINEVISAIRQVTWCFSCLSGSFFFFLCVCVCVCVRNITLLGFSMW